MPFLSLSSFFVLAGGFCYLWVKERPSKNLAYGTGVFLAVLVFYTFVFLIPVHSRYYHDMSDYWNASFSMASATIRLASSPLEISPEIPTTVTP